MPATTGSFTFSAARARAAASQAGQALPPMPAAIDGSTLYVSAGPALVEVYGQGGTSGDALPALVIVEGRVPVVSSTGVSAAQLESYLLEQPGISPQLAAEVRALGDPSSILPIPVPLGQANSRTVQIEGVSGILVGDSTGTGSALVWQKDGIIYLVAGTLTDTQVLAVAESLR
jgi:hypothetical protein